MTLPAALRRRAAAAIAAAVVALALTAAAPVSGAPGAAHRMLGAVQQRTAARALLAAAAAAPDTAPVTYHGGAVMHQTVLHAVFWTPPKATAFPSGYRELIGRYLGDLAHDSGRSTNPYAVDIQYGDAAGPVAYASAYAGAVDVHDAVANGCTPASKGAICISDGQIIAMLHAHGAAASERDLYVVFTPPGVESCFSPTECSTNVYCAYHSSDPVHPTGPPLLYSDEPYPIQGCGSGQAPNGMADAESAIDSLSHEVNEAVTDPTGSGWYTDATGNEVGDKCTDPADYGPPLGGAPGQAWNQVVAGDRWWTQSEWSNDGLRCLLEYGAPTTALTASQPLPEAGETVTLTSTSVDRLSPLTSYVWSFGDGSAPVTTSTPSVAHAFGVGSFTAAVTVADAPGNSASATTSVSASPGPVASFATPTARARVPLVLDASASSSPSGIARYAWSFGDGRGARGPQSSRRHVWRHPGRYLVSLTISDGRGVADTTTAKVTVEATCVVPALVGVTPAQARAALERAGCRPGATGGRRSALRRTGRVVGTVPAAGTVLAARARVSLVIGRGPAARS
jgi:hypothetical protein